MTLAQAFEHAWYCSLNDLEDRSAMVECGVKALESDFDAPEICELAGAGALESDALRALFLRAAAAAAVGVWLPDANRARTWCVRLANKMDSDGHTSSRTADQRTHDNLWVLHEELKDAGASERSSALLAFVEHLGLYTTHEIDDYPAWIDGLCARRDLALKDEIDEITKARVDGTTDLIAWFSYGAVTEEHARKSSELLLLGA